MKKQACNESARLKYLNTNSIAVYIHIPFCAYRCHYCNFYLETTFSQRILKQTVDGILEECRQEYIKLGRPNINSLYIGGGTPSLLSAYLIDYLLGGLQVIWGNISGKEASFEMNPESCTAEKLLVLARYGFRRISLGVQSFNEKFLKEMGRRCQVYEVERAIDLLKRQWPGSFSLDIITGYPAQTKKELEVDIKKALLAKPAHISLYDLTVEEETPLQALLNSGALQPLEEEKKEELWLYARQLLKKNGYLDYEISNFALEKKEESQHNYAYWNLEPYLGLGPGAVSMFLVESQSKLQAFRSTNPKLFDYRRREGAVEEHIEAQDYLFEHFLVGLRTREGVSKQKIQRRFGTQAFKQMDKLLKKEAGQALRSCDKAWKLNEEGRVLLNPFLLRLEQSMAGEDWKFLEILGY